jgi:hypothetical protein
VTAAPPEAAVAATRQAARRERRKGRRKLLRKTRGFVQDLPWLAAGLGALFSREARAQSTVDMRFLFYKESGGRTQVLNPMVLYQPNLGENVGQVSLLVGYDAISGASPSGAYPTSDVTTSASGKTSTNGNIPQVQYNDTRKSLSLSYGRKFGANLPSVDVSYAKENDYTARTIGLSDAWTLAEGRGTLHLGVSFSRDIVAPVTNTLQLAKNTNGYSLGWTWILGERDLFDVSGSLMKLSGYLDDPYKVVPVGQIGTTVTAPDHRPDTRARWAVVAKYGHYYLWDGALKLTYRYYWDDWSVRAHTLEALYDQHVGSEWIVSPQIRLYTQSAASFYGSLFSRPQTFLSSDYRLSPFYSVLGGLTVSRKITDDLLVSLGATVQAQVGRDQVVPLAVSPGGARGAATSAADLTVTTVTAGFRYQF